jgi:hypothetical protein
MSRSAGEPTNLHVHELLSPAANGAQNPDYSELRLEDSCPMATVQPKNHELLVTELSIQVIGYIFSIRNTLLRQKG